MAIFGTIPIFVVKIYQFLKVMATIGTAVGGLMFLGLYSYQSSLIYPSSLNGGREYCATPDEYDMPEYETINLRTEDGETLHCYSLKQDKSSPSYSNKTVLILSPNAGNIGHALPLVSIFYKNFGYNVFIYSYRGYGKSTGTASEKGLKIDAQRVMRFITVEDQQFSASSIILYGRSLGGAVAIYMAANFPTSVDAIILENTFLSLRKTVPHIFPFLKYLTMFVNQVWDSESLVPSLSPTIPVLLMSARKDEIVPPQHMDQIYEMLKTDDKTMYKYEDSQHNDTVTQNDYWERIQTFIRDKVNPIGY